MVQTNGNVGWLHAVDSLMAKNDTALAMAVYANIQPTNKMEQNYWQYYQWLFALGAGNQLSAADSANLYLLAKGCPLTEGMVVYAARNLYQSLIGDVLDWTNDCGEEWNYRKAPIAQQKAATDVPKKLAENSAVLLYPNPTRGSVNIQLPVGGNWQIAITDLSGRVVWQQHCTGCQGIVKPQLPQGKGVYLVKTTHAESGKQTVQKLVVQ